MRRYGVRRFALSDMKHQELPRTPTYSHLVLYGQGHQPFRVARCRQSDSGEYQAKVASRGQSQDPVVLRLRSVLATQ